MRSPERWRFQKVAKKTPPLLRDLALHYRIDNLSTNLSKKPFWEDVIVMSITFPSPVLLRLLLLLLFCSVGLSSAASASALSLMDGAGTEAECGSIARGSRMFHARIKGGVKIHITDFPHAVSIRKGDKHHCGGSLVGSLASWHIS